ncbi:MAG: patatin-like phospholipase family protein [Candidatus Woesearchaeota archaeon]
MKNKKNVNRKSLGIALASGGARGGAHVGALKRLLEENIQIDEIVGCSIGSIVGAYFCAGKFEKLTDYIENFNTRSFMKLLDPKIRGTHGLILGEKIKEMLRKDLGDLKFSDLKIKLKIVSTNFITGKKIVFERGSVIEAIRASISIPFIFEPANYKNLILVDGGLLDPLPIELLDSDFKLGICLSYINPKESFNSKIRIIQRTLVIMEKAIIEEKIKNLAKENKLNNVLIITPKVSAGHPFDFDTLKDSYIKGYMEMSKKIKLLKKLLGENNEKM